MKQHSSAEGAVVVVKVSDLTPLVRYRLEEARDESGWDRLALDKAMREEYDFLGRFISSQIKEDAEGSEWLAVQFTPPLGRNLDEAERSFDAALDVAAAGAMDTAKARFQGLVHDFPEVAKYRAALGQAHFETGDIEAAEHELLAALALHGREPSALTTLGNLYMNQNKHEQALQLHRTAVEVDPSARNLTNLGAALGEMGHLDKAIDRFQEATKLDPSYEQAHHGLQITQQRKAGRQT